MNKKHMIPPSKLEIRTTVPEPRVEPKQVNRSGIQCGCGSSDVEVTTSELISSRYPHFINRERKRKRRQYFQCRACGRKGVRIVEQVERIL